MYTVKIQNISSTIRIPRVILLEPHLLASCPHPLLNPWHHKYVHFYNFISSRLLYKWDQIAYNLFISSVNKSFFFFFF